MQQISDHCKMFQLKKFAACLLTLQIWENDVFGLALKYYIFYGVMALQGFTLFTNFFRVFYFSKDLMDPSVWPPAFRPLTRHKPNRVYGYMTPGFGMIDLFFVPRKSPTRTSAD